MTLQDKPIRFLPAGDSAVLVQFGDQVDLQTNQKVQAAAKYIQDNPILGIEEVIAGYCTLLVHYDLMKTNYMDVMNGLSKIVSNERLLPQSSPRRIEIPVRYGGKFGFDLEFVAQHTHLTPEEVIQKHSAAVYTVFMIGFTPGFAYLGGLDPAIATPRLQTPRTLVPAGSVGIAGMQTGVYPIDSPGGWQIIGHSPTTFFDPQSNPPCLLNPGDEVVFIPIKSEED